MTELTFDTKAIRWLEQREQHLRERIMKKLEQAKQHPERYFKRLSAHDVYRLRVGDYRVIADITDETIHVLLIGHRSNVYK